MTLFRFNLRLTLVVSPNCGICSGEAVEVDGSRIPLKSLTRTVTIIGLSHAAYDSLRCFVTSYPDPQTVWLYLRVS
jgi:hypothetical protein